MIISRRAAVAAAGAGLALGALFNAGVVTAGSSESEPEARDLGPDLRPEWVRDDGTIDADLGPARVNVVGRDGEVIGSVPFSDALTGDIPDELRVQPEPTCTFARGGSEEVCTVP